MLFSLAKALVVLAALVTAGATMYVTTIIATKLGVGGGKGTALGCLAAIVALVVLAAGAFQLLDAWLSGAV
ncbi:MAG: hypothetical protein M3Q49_01665 [Actinomycetota bacterium]|nr:hypothetical protein [Actinomycetota bacterium]